MTSDVQIQDGQVASFYIQNIFHVNVHPQIDSQQHCTLDVDTNGVIHGI